MKSVLVVAVAVLATLGAAAAPARGQSLEIAQGAGGAPVGGARAVSATIETLAVHATVEEGVALVDIDQTFRNPTAAVLEGVWTIPTSSGPFLSLEDRDVGDYIAGSGPDGHLVVAWADEGAPDLLFVSERVRGTWSLPSGVNDARNAGQTGVGSMRLAFDDRGNAFLATLQSPWAVDVNNTDVYVGEYR